MSVLDSERGDNLRQDMINCQGNCSDSNDQRSEWRVIASVQGNQERLYHSTIRNVETRQGQQENKFNICFSKGDIENMSGKEDENQGGGPFGLEETILRNPPYKWQIILQGK